MKTITLKNKNSKREYQNSRFEILSDFEMKKILGGEGDDDDDDNSPVEW